MDMLVDKARNKFLSAAVNLCKIIRIPFKINMFRNLDNALIADEHILNAEVFRRIHMRISDQCEHGHPPQFPIQ